LILSLLLAGQGLKQVHWTQPAGRHLNVSLVQGNVEQGSKWMPGETARIIQTYLDYSLERLDRDLILWPETAVPAYAHQLEKGLLNPLEQRLSSEGVDLLLGAPLAGEGGTYYNAMLTFGEHGRASYAKRHLVPFGEYLPFSTLLRPFFGWLRIPFSDFSRGQGSPPLLNLAGFPAAISICYEDAFGDETIQALPEARFLVNASNDAWFGDSVAPHQHLQMARMRSLETGRWMLRVTNTGITAIINQRGEVVSRMPQFEEGALDGEIEMRHGATPYVRLGDWPVLLSMLAGLLIGSICRRTRV
jgi:apolipoprotein N-acyltransferase